MRGRQWGYNVGPSVKQWLHSVHVHVHVCVCECRETQCTQWLVMVPPRPSLVSNILYYLRAVEDVKSRFLQNG